MSPLVAVRYVVPAALLVAGVACLFVVNDSARLEAWAGLTGAGLSVFLLNLLYRVGVQGDEERQQGEEAARAYFDEHGEWPEEEERPRGRRWTLPEGVDPAEPGD
ncbi:MAG: hypothetical protein QOJ22_868 [Thermoleophilaceae bacterium]|jgi:hypothetical protein|nr:hypothetical protein [Thermoleophilaceae bacterium]